MRGNIANGPMILTSWHSINWKKVNRIVNNLRHRIFRAVKEGDYKKARSLQKLMLRSYSNILHSVRRVTQINRGRKTPGIDKRVALTPSTRMELVKELTQYTIWKTKPVRRIYIPKYNDTKKRPLGIPTISCRAHQAIVKNALEPEWEAKFEGSSYGFRLGRSQHDAIGRVYHICKARTKKRWALIADVKGAFDYINHPFLLKAISYFPAKEMIKQWLKAGYVEYGEFHKTETGTPQGGVVSPLLCNIALHGMEEALGVKYNDRGDCVGDRSVVRFADDFRCFCETREDAYKCKEILKKWLYQRGLQFSEEKTKIVHVTEGFDFLGYNVRLYKVNRSKSGWKLFIKPSKKAINRIREKLRELWKSIRGYNAEYVMKKLNPIIRGWTNYHRVVVAKRVFSSLDNWMFAKANKWIKHSHPKKGKKWRCQKYWGNLNPKYPKDNWVFGNKKTGAFLLKFAWTPIRRHIMVKGNASPDDPELRQYWEKRRKEETKLFSQSKYKIAQKQGYKCLICNQYLINGEKLQIDHIDPGGGDKYNNLQLLHLYCHQQKHFAKQRKYET